MKAEMMGEAAAPHWWLIGMSGTTMSTRKTAPASKPCKRSDRRMLAIGSTYGETVVVVDGTVVVAGTVVDEDRFELGAEPTPDATGSANRP